MRYVVVSKRMAGAWKDKQIIEFWEGERGCWTTVSLGKVFNTEIGAGNKLYQVYGRTVPSHISIITEHEAKLLVVGNAYND